MDKTYEKFRKHFPQSDDITLIVLKGHLLIEENIFTVAAEQFEKPLCLKQAELSFSKLRWIAEGLLYQSCDKWLWTAIGKLNQLRNDLAHELDPPKLDTKLDDFLRYMKNECPLKGFFSHAKTATRAELLRRALADIIFYLMAMKKPE